ncbi:MAG TPA: cyclic nucleotide-binding domain-containing protein [Mycobacteriales bacterium]|jgi:hypothetical protein|nr:cyclic nucleotide-binding domain-containing protein [Mycobacteriales bacterium]
MRVESHVTSLSWIPSEAVTGAMRTAFATGISHYDSPPPDVLGELAEMRAADAFRFANRLSVWAEFAGDEVVDHGVDGGVVVGSTLVRVGPLGVAFAAVPMPDLRGEPEIGAGWVRFTQTAGGRTALPLPRRIAKRPFIRLQSPLVWTTLTITLHSDGRVETTLAGASPFPRHWVYGDDDRLMSKAGLADWQGWTGQETWRRTPWGEEDSPVVVTAVETALERELSTVIMRGGRRPAIRSLPADAILVEQGEPGYSLFLLLDGVLSVAVDGQPVAELGPGVVVGERAVLEGGVRTSTLTAVTPVRIAEVPGESVDRSALARLAEGHRREETTA